MLTKKSSPFRRREKIVRCEQKLYQTGFMNGSKVCGKILNIISH
jgi:hypothetical protein